MKWGKWIIILILSVPFTAHAVELKPFITAQAADLQQFVSIGGTFHWDRFDLDLSQGVKTVHCNDCRWDDSPESATILTGRLYPFHFQRLRPFLMYQHASDIFRGPPLKRSVKEPEEPTVDYAAIGLTFKVNRYLEFDFSYGRQSLKCEYFEGPCHWENAAHVAVRWYPFRTFKFEIGERR